MNDGSFPDAPEDATLVAQGTVGEIVQVGHHVTPTCRCTSWISPGGGGLPGRGISPWRARKATSMPAALFDDTLVRILGALQERVRYRYVQPVVVPAACGWKIVSPCCSRNVDPHGGIIDVAWLEPGWAAGACTPRPPPAALGPHSEAAELAPLLDRFCGQRRVFWP